ncbi:hypothetical protein [Nocardiopsis sp. NPDC055824]
MARTTRRRALIGVVTAVSALVGLGAYLLWPAPTLDATDFDTVLPTERDLPGFIPYDGLTGTLSVSPDNDEGRSVLAEADLDEQCRTWREEGDGWACRQVRGVGMVVLEQSENVFFRVLSYDDEKAAEAVWNGLTADQRRTSGKLSDFEKRPSDLGDAGVVFEVPGVTVMAVRTGPVVVESIVWAGSDQVGEQEERDMVARWPALQLAKIEEQLD